MKSISHSIHTHVGTLLASFLWLFNNLMMFSHFIQIKWCPGVASNVLETILIRM